MAEFDAESMTPEQQLQHQLHQLQIQHQHLIGQFQRMQQNQVQQPVLQHIPPPTRPNLNLPQPPYFSGNPLELTTLKIKLTQFIRGNFNTYFDDQSQLMCASSLLSGPAQQWYETLLEPGTVDLPIHYTLDSFLAELTGFFGGGLTLASREHALDDLRQTGSVSVLAIAFQNIINTYIPRWTDSASIYFFSKKLKEAIRFEVTARGNVPTALQAYIAKPLPWSTTRRLR